MVNMFDGGIILGKGFPVDDESTPDYTSGKAREVNDASFVSSGHP